MEVGDRCVLLFQKVPHNCFVPSEFVQVLQVFRFELSAIFVCQLDRALEVLSVELELVLDRDVLSNVTLILAYLRLESSQVLHGVQTHIRASSLLMFLRGQRLRQVLVGVDDAGHDEFAARIEFLGVGVVVT